MLTITGLVALVFGAVLYLGQLISVIDFRRAQQFGLQEKAEASDPLHGRLEKNTAWWDLLVLWAIPVAGILMLIGHAWWPLAALIAGAIAIDTGGREAAKILGLRATGVRTGDSREVRVLLGTHIAFLVIGVWMLGYGVSAIG